MVTVNRSSLLPLYAQIKEAVQHEIETSMAPGDMLPIEPELEKRFGVSRITIRRALDELEAEGLIVRQQGKGTFVREQGISHNLSHLVSWTLAMRQLGYEPRTISTEVDVVEPSRDIRAMLDLASGRLVVRIRRVRSINEQPLCIMTNYLPQQLLPHLATEELVDDSLYLTLLAHNIRPAHIEDKVEVRLATEQEAWLLGVVARSPLLQVTRLSSDITGRALVVDVVASRADKYSYRTALDIPQKER